MSAASGRLQEGVKGGEVRSPGPLKPRKATSIRALYAFPLILVRRSGARRSESPAVIRCACCRPSLVAVHSDARAIPIQQIKDPKHPTRHLDRAWGLGGTRIPGASLAVTNRRSPDGSTGQGAQRSASGSATGPGVPRFRGGRFRGGLRRLRRSAWPRTQTRPATTTSTYQPPSPPPPPPPTPFLPRLHRPPPEGGIKMNVPFSLSFSLTYSSSLWPVGGVGPSQKAGKTIRKRHDLAGDGLAFPYR